VTTQIRPHPMSGPPRNTPQEPVQAQGRPAEPPASRTSFRRESEMMPAIAGQPVCSHPPRVGLVEPVRAGLPRMAPG
jgi:hypothetical protein